MKKHIFFLLILAIFTACNTTETMKYSYPQAKTVDSSSNYFGTEVPAPYRWMENEQDSDLVKWIDAENNLTQDFLSKISYRDKILDRLKSILNYEKITTPSKRGGRYFFYKNDGLQNQYVLYVQDDLQSQARILLDPNTLSDDGTVALSTAKVSKDGKYLAYAIAKSGSDWNEIYVKNIETGEVLSDHIEWVKFSDISWYKDGFYYSRFDEPEPGKELLTVNTNQKVYYHKIGTSQADDTFIYGDDENPTYGFGATVSDDEHFLIIPVWQGTSGNMLLFKDLTIDDSDFIQLNDDFNFDYSFIDDLNGKLLFRTNMNAPNYKIIAIDPQNPAQDNWIDFIPETENVMEAVSISKNNIIIEYMQDVKSVLKTYDFDGKYIKDLALPGIGNVGGVSANKDDDYIFYKFSSYVNPGTIYKYDFNTDSTTVFHETNFSGIDLSQFIVEQKFYESKDGTQIPMFIIHKKDIELNGNNPTWLYGYGGFNISLTPGFSILKLLWLENGGVYVVANIRGGGEYGENWHKQGILMNKQNVFDDFIAAAEYLIGQKYTNPDLLAIQGGSNGGLLVGAVTNQRPELFKVAIPEVGVMDMLRFQLFTIGRAWASDYGLSTDSEEMFKYLYAYSPLHNIDSTKEYPAILVTTADHDDRVVPLHSFKYIATLQALRKDNKNPLLIRIDTKSGHGAGKPIDKVLEEWADVFAFAFYNMGITPKFD